MAGYHAPLEVYGYNCAVAGYHAPLEVYGYNCAAAGYHAPLEVYGELQRRVVESEQSSGASQQASDRTVNVCVGKEWYRFPSNFFLPHDRSAKFAFKLFIVRFIIVYFIKCHNFMPRDKFVNRLFVCILVQPVFQ